MPDISSTDDNRKGSKGGVRSSRSEQKPIQSVEKKTVSKRVPDMKSHDRKRPRASSKSSSSSSSESSDSSSSSESSASHSPKTKSSKVKVATTKSAIPDSRSETVSRSTEKKVTKSLTQSKPTAPHPVKVNSHKSVTNSLSKKDHSTPEIVEPPKSKPKMIDSEAVSTTVDSVSTERSSKKLAEPIPNPKPTLPLQGNFIKKDLSAESFKLPEFTRIMISKLTRNVTEAHISEIFSTWGKLVSVEMPMDHMHPEFGRGYAYVDFATPEAASDAVNYMNGGQLDGQEVVVTEVMPRFPKQTTPPRPRNKSPIKGGESRDLSSSKDRTALPKPSRNHEVNSSSSALPRTLESDRSRISGNRDRDRAREQERQREKDREQRVRDRERASKGAVAQRTSPSTRDRERVRAVQKDPRSRDRDRRSHSDRDRNRSRGNRRDSSSSPFASRPGRQRSPVASRYRRPSPPPRGSAAVEGRRGKSKSPVNRSGRATAVDKKSKSRIEPKATVTSSESNRRKKTSTRSSSSSSNSSSSSSSSGSSSGSSSSSSTSSSPSVH